MQTMGGCTLVLLPHFRGDPGGGGTCLFHPLGEAATAGEGNGVGASICREEVPTPLPPPTVAAPLKGCYRKLDFLHPSSDELDQNGSYTSHQIWRTSKNSTRFGSKFDGRLLYFSIKCNGPIG